MSEELDVNQILALSGGEEPIEQEDQDILEDSKDFTEQDLAKVDEGESVMEVTPADHQVKVVPEANLKLVTRLLVMMRMRLMMRRRQGLISTWTL